MIRIFSLTLLIFAGMAVSATAQGRHGGAYGDLWQQADTDTDGRITRAEADAARAGMFASSDTDGNGLLSAKEMAAAQTARMEDRAAERAERHLDRMDANGDGALSLEEMPTMARLFERLDANEDGAIDAEERATRQDRHGPKRQKRG